MKQSPDNQKLDALLRSSALVAGGFMGHDPRSVAEIIEADAAALADLGVPIERIVARMAKITEQALEGLGNWVRIDARCQAQVEESRGGLPCPWDHAGRYLKRVTTVEISSHEGRPTVLRWSDLSAHLIAAHGFFQGKGSPFRIEPVDAARLLS